MPRYRTKEQQLAICEAWKQSKLTQTEFCRQNNIQFYALNRWLRNIKKSALNSGDTNKNDSPPTVKDIKFLSIDNPSINLASNSYNRSLLEVTLPNGMGFKAYLPEGSINAYLRELLK